MSIDVAGHPRWCICDQRLDLRLGGGRGRRPIRLSTAGVLLVFAALLNGFALRRYGGAGWQGKA